MMSNDQNLLSISPLDGRYSKKIEQLCAFVSEAALIQYRLKVEALWFLHLAQQPEIEPYLHLDKKSTDYLQSIVNQIPQDALHRVKELESRTNHDVKAIEYYLREKLQALGAQPSSSAFIHFACTSEDINNLAYGLMLADVRREVLLPTLDLLISRLSVIAEEYAGVSMLSKTHGQNATPTTIGKELAVFGYRLLRQRQKLKNLEILGKINGAVGNFNAHRASFADIDWPNYCKQFVEQKLRLTNNPLTTQIESHDSFVEYCQIIQRINAILVGFCRDLWSYIAMDYFRQKPKPDEVGSSTMPHKINPIDFENAEGNLGIANSFAHHFAEKLPISRLQRDLSDSTVLRNFGSFVGYSVLAYKSILSGLDRIEPNMVKFLDDLNHAWEVLAEPIQMLLRKHGKPDAYEYLKEISRGKAVDRQALINAVQALKILNQDDLDFVKRLIPADYIGYAKELALEFVTAWKKVQSE